MKYIIGLHALIFLIVILMGCNSTPNRSILRQVESYMEEHPDSALFLLNSIAHPEKLSGREQAEYALFYTQSCEKNFILQLNDSLIKIAVDYFESQAGGLKTAQSYFYMGCIYQNRNEHANAVRAFIKALENAPSNIRSRILMQIHFYLAESYNNEGLYNEAKKHYFLSYENAIYRKDTLDMYYPLRGIGTAYSFKLQYDSALVYYNKALEISCRANNNEMKAYVLSSIAGCYEAKNDFEKANEYATKVINLGVSDCTNMYEVKGNSLMHLNRLDSAYYYLKLSVTSTDLNTKAIAYYHLYNLLKKKSYLEVIACADSFILYKDSLIAAQQYDEIQNIREEHFQRVKEQEIFVRRCWLILGFMCLCFIGAIIFLFLERKRKLHYARLNQTLAEMKLANVKRYIEEELGDSVELDDELMKLEESELKKCICDFQKTIWYRRIVNLDEQYLSAKEQRELLSDLLAIFPHIIERLRMEYPTIKDVDVYFCILSIIGFRLKKIAFCLRTNDRNLSTRKSRLKKNLSKKLFEMVFSNN